MKIFSYLYNKTISWSGHRQAPYYLAGVSFTESFIFPIPPDVMLITMGLATPPRAWRYAFIAMLFSVIGGILGYFIGMYAMEFIRPWLLDSAYKSSYLQVQQWFAHGGVWVVVLAAFTPLPYKLFTITAGAMQMLFLPFVLGSIIGRGGRFFLVSALLYFTGDSLHAHLRRYVDIIGWSVLTLLVMVYVYMHFS